jgi:hypothetical protein
LSIFIVSNFIKKDIPVINANLIDISYLDKSYLLIKSNSAIGDIKINANDFEGDYIINLNTKSIPLDAVKKPYKIETAKYGDNIINYNLKLISKYPLEYFKLFLIAPSDKYPLDSNLIFQTDNNFKLNYDKQKQVVYKFYIGRNIRNDFLFNVTLLSGNYELYTEIEYPFIESSVAEIDKSNAVITKSSIFYEKFFINN